MTDQRQEHATSVENGSTGLESAAHAGDVSAMVRLGVIAAESQPPDVTAARFWFERAARAGDSGAMLNLGLLLVNMCQPPDLRAAREWWTRAAEAGDDRAAAHLVGLPPDANPTSGPSATSPGPRPPTAMSYGAYPSTTTWPTQPPTHNPGPGGLAIASFVLGLIGCFPLAIIFGCIALYLTKKHGYGGRGMAIAGLIMAGVWLSLGLALLLLDDGPTRNDAAAVTATQSHVLAR